MTSRLFPVVILAGGLATRLRPLTESIPKALVDIHGEPFIAHQLRLLKKQGMDSVMLCLGYRGEMIMDFIGTGQQYGLNISYSLDGEQLLGTAGAIKKALPDLPEAFFVLYGDSYLPCDFSEVQKAFLASGKQGLMTVFHNAGQWDTSNVQFQQNRIIAYDKVHKTKDMHHIDYGLGVFNKNAFHPVPHSVAYDLANVYQTLLAEGQLAAHPITERFYEVGSFVGMEELQMYLCSQ